MILSSAPQGPGTKDAASEPARAEAVGVRLAVAKAALLVVALAASWLLRSTPHGDLWVAAGLFAGIAGIGPLLHRHMIVG
ncbi:hypothetical protein [Actinomadura sp. B10D3]|uniref:hypothetical protein n=1 Tax=Actinomadura sp. B10D3 TaxID=3153557 RepID=UPI00325F0AE1